MAKLQECKACHRHIAHSESTCPFCGDLRTSGPGPSVVLAGALVGMTALGCGDTTPAANDPSKDDTVQVGESDAMAASPVDTEEVEEVEKRETRDDMPPMPYGAPPARHRLV